LRKGEGKVNHVITSTDLKVKCHSCSNLSTSYGSRLRHIHRAQV
jgi:ribosomal protein S27E